MSSCNLYLERRRGESDEKFLKRWMRLEKKIRLKEELVQKSALTRRHEPKPVARRRKRQEAERERQRELRKKEKRSQRSKGYDPKR